MEEHFVFVDETGDLGLGGTPHFGFGILELKADSYESLRELLAEERTRVGLYRKFEVDSRHQLGRALLQKLSQLSEIDIVHASGLYIHKVRYRGRYLSWFDSDARLVKLGKPEASHRLRNYLLRQSLEHRFSLDEEVGAKSIHLVLDRISINRRQRTEMEDYLVSTPPHLQRPFRFPPIALFVISDSRYTGGLQLAHLVADIVKEHAKHPRGTIDAGVSGFVRVTEFLGSRRPADAVGIGE